MIHRQQHGVDTEVATHPLSEFLSDELCNMYAGLEENPRFCKTSWKKGAAHVQP